MRRHFAATALRASRTMAAMDASLPPRSPGLPMRAAALALAASIAAAFAGEAIAQDAVAVPASNGLDPALDQQVRSLALAASGSGAAVAGVSRVEVVVGQLDPRLHLAPCARIEPYLPSGSRLWGKARIGLRCVQGPSPWNVFLPIVVKAYGRALVVPGGATAGAVLKQTDLAEAEIDLAEEFTPALLDPAQAVGRTLAQALKPGQSLRQAHLKPRQWFVAGDTVKVTAKGNGFSLEGEGQAVSNGVEGQTARIRTESGHIVSGLPVGERRIEVAL